MRPVAVGERLFTVLDDKLVALDAATGETVQTFGAVNTPHEIAAAENLLLVSDKAGVRAFTAGQPRWQWTGAARRMVAADGKVFCLGDSEVVCLTLATGQSQWRTAPVARRGGGDVFLRLRRAGVGMLGLARRRHGQRDRGR